MFPQGTVMDALTNFPTAGTTTKIYGPPPGPVSSPNRRSKPTHATTLGFAYVNETGRDAFQSQPFAFPVGSVIVRETLLARDAQPERLVVMVKHEKSFNPKANGWEFLTVNGDRTKVLGRQKRGKCLACHVSATENDFVFPGDKRR